MRISDWSSDVCSSDLHDALTGLPNRTLFEDRLSSALSQSRRSLKQVAVLLLDLDRFKHNNDSLGHHIGDQLLEAVAMRLHSCVSESDTAARPGGDQFVHSLATLPKKDNDATEKAKISPSLSAPLPNEQQSLHLGS